MRIWLIAAIVVGAGVAVLAAETVLNSAPPPPPAAQASDATIKEIMDSMVDPSGDFVFSSIQEISDANGISEKAPQTDAEWADVRHHLTVLHDVPKLLTQEGRKVARPGDKSLDPKVENEPQETQELIDADRAGFQRHAQALEDAAALAIKAVDARDKTALKTAITAIDKACESCHLAYFYPHDRRAQQAATEEGVAQ